MQRNQGDAIIGDVVATEIVTVNNKGGSVAAILKKPLRERLGAGTAEPLSGAAVEFETGQTVVLLSRQAGTEGGVSTLRVRKVGANRFEIGIAANDEDIDGVTAAFLRLKMDLFEKGKLHLDDPLTAEEWRAEMHQKLAGARAARRALRPSASRRV